MCWDLELLSSSDALLAHKPHKWRRDKWTGFLPAVRDLLLLDAIHGLLQPTFHRFLELQAGAEPGEAGERGAAEETAAERQPRGGRRGQQSGTGTGQAGVDIEVIGATASDARAHTETSNLARENAKNRAAALLWMDSGPGQILMLLMVALRPLDRFLGQSFELCGVEWEQQQRAKEAEGMLQGRAGDRQYRVEVAALGLLEQSFFENLEHLYFEEEPWSVFSAKSMTESFNSFIFRLLSRLGAAVEQHVVHGHQQYPCRLFKLLEQRDGC